MSKKDKIPEDKKPEVDKSDDKTMMMPIFMCIGISVGVGIGAATDNIPIGMSIGIGVGLCVGALIDRFGNRKKDDYDKSDEK